MGLTLHARVKRLTLNGKLDKASGVVAYGDVEVLFFEPAKESDTLLEHAVSLKVIRLDAPTAFLFDGGSEGVRVEAVHDQLLHGLLGVVKLGVVEGGPDLALLHAVRDEGEEVKDELDLVGGPIWLLGETLDEAVRE